MLLYESATWLLVDNCSHVTCWAVVCHHVKVLKCLEGVVQLGDELMVDFPLDLLFSDDEASESIVGPLFHSFHSVELSCASSPIQDALDKVNLCVGTRSQDPYPLEVRSLHVEVAKGHRSGVLAGSH